MHDDDAPLYGFEVDPEYAAYVEELMAWAEIGRRATDDRVLLHWALGLSVVSLLVSILALVR